MNKNQSAWQEGMIAGTQLKQRLTEIKMPAQQNEACVETLAELIPVPLNWDNSEETMARLRGFFSAVSVTVTTHEEKGGADHDAGV